MAAELKFKTKVLSFTKKQIQAWHLPDRILEELYLFLGKVLPSDIEHNLMRADVPFQGMVTSCTRRDRDIVDQDHHFEFLVYFGHDEQTLHIARGAYEILDY